MTRMVVLIIELLLLILLVTSCRSGIYDPDKVIHYSDKAISWPLDLFIDSRSKTGAGTLVAGAAVVDISPYNYRVWISGFGPGNISCGVRDPIYARAVFLDDGRESIVLASLDLTGLLKPDIDRIRSLVSLKYRDRIIISSTHNHMAPDTIGYWGFGLGIPLENGVIEQYQQEMIHKAAKAINQAIRNAKPARLRFGSAEIPAGWSANLWFPDDETAKDNQMSVIRADTLNGQAVFTLINWACHAEALMGKKHKISAEFPGEFYRATEEAGGGVGLFFQGALGGMVVPYPNRWDKRRSYKFKDRLKFNRDLGELLSRKAQQSIAGAQVLGHKEIRIRLARRDLELPVAGKMFTFLDALGIFPDSERIDKERKILQTEMYALSLGPATMVSAPGEIFPAIGFAIKERMKTDFKFVFGLTSDELGYMMLPEQFRDKTYKYERRVSMGPQTGTLVQQAAFDLLAEMDALTGGGLP